MMAFEGQGPQPKEIVCTQDKSVRRENLQWYDGDLVEMWIGITARGE